ncbi:MAG: PEGA domain-containing protein [Lachnospiraceae bacterium]|nr:PEGA domain-containing protein [Lachnospiraceae bacterium]
MSKKKYRVLFLFLSCLLLFSGCVKRSGGSRRGTAGLYKEQQETTTEVEDTRSGTTDVVVVTDIDTQTSQLTVQSVKDSNVYTLNYNGGTRIQNRFGTEMLIQDLQQGEIAEVNFTSGKQKLLSIKEADAAWENTTVTKWSVDYDAKLISIGSNRYSYDDNLVVLSNGKKIDIHQLHSVDSLVVKGIDKQIYSIDVKVGHGYIKITGETNLLGGLIEVGTKIMTVISENMIIVAPEGTYTLTASKNGVGGSMEITVKRNDETSVSLAGFQGEVERQGNVKFNIQPAGIQYNVFIDGDAVDVTEPVPLSYGKHKLVITSDKYTDYVEEIVISSIYMNKTIDLSKSAETQETTSKETETTTGQQETSTGEEKTTSKETETTSGSGTQKREDGVETSTGASENNNIVVTGPANAEIYMDGVYKGKAPATFPKVVGSHIFVIRAEGYITTAYNYTFDSTAKDVYIKFPDLEQSGS